MIPELLKVETPEENLHRGLGLYSLKENGYRVNFSSNVDIRVHQEGDTKRVEYHTPIGMVSVMEVITEEMKSAGASITWLEERAIKSVDDYRILKYIFENIEIKPDYGRYSKWQNEVGDDGVAIQMGAFAPSPLQHIQRDLLEATEFFYHYNDHQQEMQSLAEGIEQVYEQLLQTVAKSSAEIVLCGGPITMEMIGRKFKTGEVFIPEVLLSARAMNEALKVLEPHLAKEKKEASGKLIVGTVRGDLHDIGKNMVVTMLRGVGFEVEDFGINIKVEEFVNKVAELKPDILGLSALLTTTMPEMKKIIDALKESGLRDKVKVMVGGAPVNETYARQIGADGYAADAGESVDIAKQLLR